MADDVSATPQHPTPGRRLRPGVGVPPIERAAACHAPVA